MNDKDAVIKNIQEAFGKDTYPGDNYLQGSFDGCERYEEVEPFKGQEVWPNISSALLDDHYWCPPISTSPWLEFDRGPAQACNRRRVTDPLYAVLSTIEKVPWFFTPNPLGF